MLPSVGGRTEKRTVILFSSIIQLIHSSHAKPLWLNVVMKRKSNVAPFKPAKPLFFDIKVYVEKHNTAVAIMSKYWRWFNFDFEVDTLVGHLILYRKTLCLTSVLASLGTISFTHIGSEMSIHLPLKLCVCAQVCTTMISVSQHLASTFSVVIVF